MLHDIYYSRKSNKAVQLIARCQILPDKKEAVCYQEMTGDFAVYVREKDEFEKEFREMQTRRAEAIAKENNNVTIERKAEELHRVPSLEEDSKEGNAVSGLIQFLDADTYGEKIKILEGMRDELDEHILNNMAVSLDLSIESGVDGYTFLMSELKIRSRFEGKRGDRL